MICILQSFKSDVVQICFKAGDMMGNVPNEYIKFTSFSYKWSGKTRDTKKPGKRILIKVITAA